MTSYIWVIGIRGVKTPLSRKNTMARASASAFKLKITECVAGAEQDSDVGISSPGQGTAANVTALGTPRTCLTSRFLLQAILLSSIFHMENPHLIGSTKSPTEQACFQTALSKIQNST